MRRAPSPSALGARGDAVDDAVDDAHVEPHDAARDGPAEAVEDEVVEVVEPPLVERRAVQEAGRAVAGGQSSDGLGLALAAEEAEQPDADADADRGDGDRDDDERAVDPEELVLGELDEQRLLGRMEDGLEPVLDRRIAQREADDEPEEDRRDGQQHERDRHARGRFVDVRLDRGIDPALAVERQAHEPEHVEAGEARDDDADEEDPLEVEDERLAQDGVLREEARERRDACQR